MNKWIAFLLAVFQRSISRVLHALLSCWPKKFSRTPPIFVGPDNIAGLGSRIARSNPRFKMAILSAPLFSNYAHIGPKWGRGVRSRVTKALIGPIMLALIARQAVAVVYLGEAGYLAPFRDFREWEFTFLRKRGVKVVCFFTGSEIRSPEISRPIFHEAGIEAVVDYVALSEPKGADLEFGPARVAQIADRCANLIINAPNCQAGYLVRTDAFFKNFAFAVRSADIRDFQVPRLKIVHLPSRPLIKGTPIVRAAVFALKSQGFDFDYEEIIGMPNDQALSAIESAQIVINQLYMIMPGMLSIEAIERGRVLVTSSKLGADPSIPTTDKTPETPWVFANSTNLEGKLRRLLQASPEELFRIAKNSQDWLFTNFDAKIVGHDFEKWILENDALP